MTLLTKASLALAGLINLYPLVGVVSRERLAALYGIAIPGPDTLILLRHRAVLFGLLGGLMLWAAFRPELEGLAIAGGLISMLAFVALAWMVGGYGPALRTVVLADIAASALLAAAAVVRWIAA